MKRWLVSILGLFGAVAIFASVGGARAGLAAAVIGILWVAWRHDNDMGTCLPLVLIFLVAIGIVAMLLFLMVWDCPL